MGRNEMTDAEIRKLTDERDAAIWMLAEWCVAVDINGTGWDDWDEHYKEAAYRPGLLRELLDKAIEEVKAQYE
jgi:hypothetical protein